MFDRSKAQRAIAQFEQWRATEARSLGWQHARIDRAEILGLQAPDPWATWLRFQDGAIALVIECEATGFPRVSFVLGTYNSAPAAVIQAAVTKTWGLARDFAADDLDASWALGGFAIGLARETSDWASVIGIVADPIAAVMTAMNGPEATSEFLNDMHVYPLPESDRRRLDSLIRIIER